MRPWLPIVAVLAAACATLPDSQPLPAGEESAHAVTEIAPGRWHVMVRVNYFAPPTEAERLLRERAAALCPGAEAVVEDLHLVRQPHQASGDVHCGAKQAALDQLVSQLAARAAVRPSPAAVHAPVLPVVHRAPERAMVKSGAGVASERPEPGYLPPFAQVATAHPEVVAAAKPAPAATQTEDSDIAGGWIPATGDAEGPHALVVAEEDLAATPAPEKPTPETFWPAVGAAYHGLVAEAE